MTVLVTGASGFIGSVLCTELVRQGNQVRALVLPGENTKKLESLGAEIWACDLLDRQGLKGICDGIHTVFHLAALVTDWGPRERFYRAIYDATANIVEEAAGKVQRFVYMSSIAAIGLGEAYDQVSVFPGEDHFLY